MFAKHKQIVFELKILEAMKLFLRRDYKIEEQYGQYGQDDCARHRKLDHQKK